MLIHQHNASTGALKASVDTAACGYNLFSQIAERNGNLSAERVEQSLREGRRVYTNLSYFVKAGPSLVEIDDTRRSLLQICLEIARDKFKENATTIANQRVAEQFSRQAAEAEQLLDLVAGADAITVAVD